MTEFTNLFPEYDDVLSEMINNYYKKAGHSEDQLNSFINGTVFLSKTIEDIKIIPMRRLALVKFYVAYDWAKEFNLLSTEASWGKTIADSAAVNLINA